MKKMTKAMLMTALICGTVYCGAEPVHANELQEFTLDEYVVTAARTETKLVDTPANITIVGADEIESRHYTNVAEVLKDVPGANVLDNGTGTSQKAVHLNGDDRVLVLVDGRRVNSDMGLGSGRASFDLNKLPDVSLIERIEVMKGAGGALYGSDAVGGVINVITKKADRAYGKVSLAYGSNGAEDMSAMYSFKKGKTGVTVSAGKYKQDYYKYRDYASDSTKRWDNPSDFKNEKISLEIEQELTKDSNLTVGYDYAKYEGMSPSYIGNYYGSMYAEKETKNMFVKYDWTLNEKGQGYLQYYHNDQDYFLDTPKEESTDGIDIQQAVTLADNNNMVVGLSWRESEVFNDGMYAEKNSIDNLALFVNDTWEFIPSWTLNAGVRYDDHSHAGDETTFSAGLNKKFNDDSHAYINWSQVFAAPNGDDLFYSGRSSSTYNGIEYISIGQGDPNLKPETGETWTVGYETKLGDKTGVGINYFESNLEDAIDWITVTSGSQNEISTTMVLNIDEQKKRGMELTLNHDLNDNVSLNASYTYINVKNNGNGQGYLVDHNYMPNTYRFGVNYQDGKWDTNLWIRAASGGSTNSNAFYNYDGKKSYKVSYLDSNYVTLDMAITYKASKNLKIFAKGYNLLNEAYCETAGLDGTGNSYKYPAQSRRFLIGAEYSF